MRKQAIFWVLVLLPLIAWAAATTLTSSGDWDDISNWDGNIADDISEDVDWTSNIGIVTIRDGFSYTVNDIAMNNGNTLTIESTAVLNVGNTGIGFKLTTGNTATINVDGDLTIWGDLDVGNTLILNVSGTLIIKGDINMGNGGALDIQGNVQVDGSFVGGNNTNVNVDGDLNVDNDITVGNGSNLSGDGTVNHNGSCDDSGSGTFCDSGPLPITLSYFDATVIDNDVDLKWQTLTEENFDYFSIQRSTDLIEFKEIGTVKGNGDSQVRIDYHFDDTNPYSGTSYYRLQSFDFDGYTEIFNAVSVFVEPTNDFTIYPSVLKSSAVSIVYASSGNRVLKFRLTDMSGRNKFESDIRFDGSVEVPYNIESGIYFVELWDQGVIGRSRIIIAR